MHIKDIKMRKRIIIAVILAIVLSAARVFGQSASGTTRQDIKTFTADSTQAKQLDSLLIKHWANIKTAQQTLQNIEAEKNKILGYLQAEAIIIDELNRLKESKKIKK